METTLKLFKKKVRILYLLACIDVGRNRNYDWLWPLLTLVSLCHVEATAILSSISHYRRIQAGWHVSERLIVPPNITLVPLPPKCPELNPIENIWQYMRANWLSDSIFEVYDDIVDHCSDAWNKLAARPWTIMSIGMRDWAHRF